MSVWILRPSLFEARTNLAKMVHLAMTTTTRSTTGGVVSTEESRAIEKRPKPY